MITMPMPLLITDTADLMEAIQALDKTLSSRIDYIFTGPRSSIDAEPGRCPLDMAVYGRRLAC